MEERVVHLEDVYGPYGIRTDDGYEYVLHLKKNPDGPDRFLLRETFGEGPERRENTLEGRFEPEVESLILHGEHLHSSWHEGGQQLQERSVYDGDVLIMSTVLMSGSSTNGLRVVRNGPFKNLKINSVFDIYLWVRELF
jgi:hypothetical protein